MSQRRLSVRVSPSEGELLSVAAEHVRTNLSDVIRRKAVEAAEMDLIERRIVTIPPPIGTTSWLGWLSPKKCPCATRPGGAKAGVARLTSSRKLHAGAS